MGSFRFRRSKQVLPGVRLNVSKRGVGVSAGTRFFRVSKHSTGSSTRSAGIPGTGLYYRDQRRGGGRRRAAKGQRGGAGGTHPAAAGNGGRVRRQQGPATTVDEPRRHDSVAAMLAAAAEAAPQQRSPHHRVLLRSAAAGDLAALTALARSDAEVRHAAAGAAMLLAAERNHPGLAAVLMEEVDLTAMVSEDATSMLLHGAPPVPLVPGLTLQLPAVAALSLSCAYALNRTARYAQVLAWYPPVDPVNDATAAVTVERARACNGQGRFAAAREELAPVIRRTSLDRRVRCAALEQRALANLGAGRGAQARSDVDRIADLLPGFPSLSALRQLTAAS